MLSKRLETVAHYVPNGTVVADIGCDHAYLLIDLIQKGKISQGYACDINEGPLQSAAQNIAIHGWSEELQTRLGSGIQALTEEDAKEVLTLVIAGMGGALIAKILEDLPSVPNVETLVLQPNIGAEIIRTALIDSSFYIADECIVIDNDICYPVLVYKKGRPQDRMLNEFEKTVGPCILAQKNEAHITYVNGLVIHWKKIIQQLTKSTTDQQQKIATYTDLITKAEEWTNGDY